jgi:hypothetical protein
VLSTGLSGSAFEVSATPGGTAIVPNATVSSGMTVSMYSDDANIGYGDYVTGDQQALVWNLDTNTFTAYSTQLTAANGWASSEPTFHLSSARGYWYAYNTDYGSGVIPMATIGNTSAISGSVTIGTSSSGPRMLEYWGNFHGAGSWWLQSQATSGEYFLQSNWGTVGGGFAANAQYGISFWNVGTGQGYRLGHAYSDYVAVGSTSNYWSQPHAYISHDGKLVIYGSNMRGVGQTSYTRIDTFLMEVPVTAGTPPSFP